METWKAKQHIHCIHIILLLHCCGISKEPGPTEVHLWELPWAHACIRGSRLLRM